MKNFERRNAFYYDERDVGYDDFDEKKEKTKRESLLEELNELKDEEDTWGNRRRQRKIKRELKKLVDEM